LAFQAPNGSNRNNWRWIVVDDRALIAKLADIYKRTIDEFSKVYAHERSGIPREDKLMDSAFSLVGVLDKVPGMLVPLMPGRVEGKSAAEQAAMWGSITQAVWSFFLALRERGLGSAADLQQVLGS
jgi:nitroreductase